MGEVAALAVIDIAAADRSSTARSLRKAFEEYGFCYIVGHGVDQALIDKVFEESRRFFSLPMQQKNALLRSQHRGYTPPFSENLDPSASSIGDFKESFYVGPIESDNLNQWPSPDLLPGWKDTITAYYESVMLVAKKLVSIIALALHLDAKHFEQVGALDSPQAFLRLLYYPEDPEHCPKESIGAGAHSDYGMITLLATDGVPGLQVCRNRDKKPRQWEDVPHLPGAFIVNLGDMMERWTNCLFRSTMHRVMRTGRGRYSLAFFLDPDPDCVVSCLETCCSPFCPKRFPPIRSGDYLKERFLLTYGQ